MYNACIYVYVWGLTVAEGQLNMQFNQHQPTTDSFHTTHWLYKSTKSTTTKLTLFIYNKYSSVPLLNNSNSSVKHHSYSVADSAHRRSPMNKNQLRNGHSQFLRLVILPVLIRFESSFIKKVGRISISCPTSHTGLPSACFALVLVNLEPPYSLVISFFLSCADFLSGNVPMHIDLPTENLLLPLSLGTTTIKSWGLTTRAQSYTNELITLSILAYIIANITQISHTHTNFPQLSPVQSFFGCQNDRDLLQWLSPCKQSVSQ